jgi:hypothetical protein
LTLFALLLIIIFIAPISSAVVANGFLSYDNNKRNIQHFEGGIVEKLLVKNGDEVRKNQEIIRLSSIKNIADKKIIQWKLLSMILQKQFLELEGRGIVKIDNEQLTNKIKFLINNFSNIEKNEFTYLVANSQQYLKATINKYLKDIEIFDQGENVDSQRLGQGLGVTVEQTRGDRKIWPRLALQTCMGFYARTVGPFV